MALLDIYINSMLDSDEIVYKEYSEKELKNILEIPKKAEVTISIILADVGDKNRFYYFLVSL